MRFGLIGCGGIGAIRAEAVGRTHGCKLIAVADVDAGRAESMAAKYGCESALDWKTLVQREDIDAVIVSTPPRSHAEISIAALRAEKHVLCEKPLARTSEECGAIIDAATASGQFIATGFNYRFYPSMQKARDLLDSGIIGRLDHIRAYAGYSATAHNPPWVHDVDVMGGGALRDNGIHLIDLTRWFLGEVAQAQGFSTDGVWNFAGCEDNGFALLRGRNDAVATLQASWTEWRGYRFLLEIYGTRGCIRASCFPMMTEVTWSERPEGPFKHKRDLFPRTFIREHLHSYRALVLDSFIEELAAFVTGVNGGASAIATGFDGLRAVEIAEAVAHTQELAFALRGDT